MQQRLWQCLAVPACADGLTRTTRARKFAPKGGSAMRTWGRWIASFALALCATASAQSYQPPRHTRDAPMIGDGSQMQVLERADEGMQIERNRAPADELEEHRKLDRALH